ncbi:peptide deformylase [Acidiferrobacter sp.]|uniref:peptide deformylase n=1 Tax=Acidiferrobacter sp. TaxID=1872107 RepID=UPI00260580EB|nr:peptide deformylase [Acidiferrobacter sp.]
MAVRAIRRMGDPLLWARAQEVTDISAEVLAGLVGDMKDTMAAFHGAGLAAPQIGVPLRVVIFGVHANPRYPQASDVPETILVNPIIEPLDDGLEEAWEGCLSVPGMRGLVPRYRRVRYRGFDIDGREIVREVEGFHARVVQHECDHLDGILYPARIRDLKFFGYESVLFPEGIVGDDAQ